MSEIRGVAGHPAHILIVDDKPTNRALLLAMLESDEFVLTTAASGADALAQVALHPPDLILLDVLMPGMSGYAVATTLKGALATRNIPIIMVTALDGRDARMNGLTAGAEDFLTKPVDHAELSMRVRNLLRLKTASDTALAARDNSMGMVSHDLRNLLNGIVLQATILSQDAAETGDTAGLGRLKHILGYADRMERLVADLVDVVSIDAGVRAIELARHDVVTLLAETMESWAQAAAKQTITLRLETVAPTLLTTCDRGRILQVLGNLVTNALKFTPAGGAIAFCGERIDGGIRISVSDTGSGIPSHLLETVFDRFVQVTPNDHRGMGLGLYICRSIVESHGGKIWVESQLGERSRFSFTIPDRQATT